MLDPEMTAQEIRLHMGELTPEEVLVARAAIRWANSKLEELRPKVVHQLVFQGGE